MAAVFDIGGYGLSGGLLAVYLWRGVYFAQSVSFRTRCLLAMDWTKRAFFGRGEFVVPVILGVICDMLMECRFDELLRERRRSGLVGC